MGRQATTIHVTQEDIDKGIKRNSHRCAVARAIGRTFPDAHHIDADVQSVRLTIGDERVVYPTPWQVQQYVVDFDAGTPLVPFTFRLAHDRAMKIRRRKVAETSLEAKATNTARQKRVRKAKAAGRKPDPIDLKREPVATVTEGGEDARKAPPRTYKRSSRRYGMRAMRINWHREAAGEIDQPFRLTD